MTCWMACPRRYRSLCWVFQGGGRWGVGGLALGVAPDGGTGTSAWADAATVTRGLPATGVGAGVGVAGAVPALPPAVAGGEETPPVDAGPLEGPWAVGSLDEDMQEGSRCDLYNYRTTGERRGAMGHFLDRPGQVRHGGRPCAIRILPEFGDFGRRMVRQGAE